MSSIFENVRTITKDLSMGKKWNFLLLFLYLSSLLNLVALAEDDRMELVFNPFSFIYGDHRKPLNDDNQDIDGIASMGQIESASSPKSEEFASVDHSKKKHQQHTNKERMKERERKMGDRSHTSQGPACMKAIPVSTESRDSQAEAKLCSPKSVVSLLTSDYEGYLNDNKQFWDALIERFSIISKSRVGYPTIDHQIYVEDVVWEHLSVLFSSITKDILFVGISPSSDSGRHMITNIIEFIFNTIGTVNAKSWKPGDAVRVQYHVLNKILVRMIPEWFSELRKKDKRGITLAFGPASSQLTCTFFFPRQFFKQLAWNRFFEHESLLGMRDRIVDRSRHKDMCVAMELILNSKLDRINDLFLFLTLPHDHDSPLSTLLWRYHKWICFHFRDIFGVSTVDVFLYSPIPYESLVRYSIDKKIIVRKLRRRDFFTLLHIYVPVNGMDNLDYKRHVRKVMRKGRKDFISKFKNIIKRELSHTSKLSTWKPRSLDKEIKKLMYRIGANVVADPYLISETIMSLWNDIAYSKAFIRMEEDPRFSE